jgi:magnesium chelatase family protein
MARERAAERGVATNAEMSPEQVERWVPLTATGARLLEVALRKDRLSGRGLHRVRCVARTLADLRDEDGVPDDLLALALELRAEPGVLDRAACA